MQMPIILRGAGAFDILEDVAGLGGPDERLRIFVVMFNIIGRRADRFSDFAKSLSGSNLFRVKQSHSLNEEDQSNGD
jgi:hypothetical protein